jgi:hypothetical protein
MSLSTIREEGISDECRCTILVRIHVADASMAHVEGAAWATIHFYPNTHQYCPRISHVSLWRISTPDQDILRHSYNNS